jgi:hypothetical protein
MSTDEMGAEGGASSGPQTPQGKRRSSRNARTHGILADVLQRDGCLGDSHSDFSKLLVGLRGHYGPVGFFLNLQVEKLAIQYLRLALVYKVDLKTAPLIFTRVEAGLHGDEPPVLLGLSDSESEIAIVRRLPTLEVIMRYEACLERNIERTLNQLERQQRIRLGEPVPPPVKLDVSS